MGKQRLWSDRAARGGEVSLSRHPRGPSSPFAQLREFNPMMWGSSNPIRRWPAGGLLVAAVWLVMSFVEVAHGAPLGSVAGSDPWTERAELIPADGAASDYLGRSVAIDGDTAVVGAAAADVGDNMDQGAAYVFVRSGDTWTQTAKLTSSDGAAGDEFGFAVAISGDTIVIGSRFSAIGGVNGAGAAYVFVRSGTDWLPQGKLTADDGAAFDELGFSVAADGDTAVVGAPFANSSRGKVYVFTRSGTDWTGQAMLAADDAADFDRFGLALAVKADTLLIGSPSADIGANTDQGAVYVFDRSGVTWTSSAKLAADDGGAFDEFGNAVAPTTATTRTRALRTRSFAAAACGTSKPSSSAITAALPTNSDFRSRSRATRQSRARCSQIRTARKIRARPTCSCARVPTGRSRRGSFPTGAWATNSASASRSTATPRSSAPNRPPSTANGAARLTCIRRGRPAAPAPIRSSRISTA